MTTDAHGLSWPTDPLASTIPTARAVTRGVSVAPNATHEQSQGGRGLRYAIFGIFCQFTIFRNSSHFFCNFLTCPSYVPAGVVQGHRSELLHSVPFLLLLLLLLTVLQFPHNLPQFSAVFPQFFAIGFNLPRPQSPPPCQQGSIKRGFLLHFSFL